MSGISEAFNNFYLDWFEKVIYKKEIIYKKWLSQGIVKESGQIC